LDLSELGEGARNLILIALLKSFAKNFKNHGGALSGILALEEPEVFFTLKQEGIFLKN
jgi:putative ATP-dependent endonuclease of the OLD family